jgi:hypothetical protein
LNKPSAKKPQSEWTWTQVVPDVDGERRKWFDKAHAQDGGHMRRALTYARLQEWVYWDSMWADCERWCKECVICDLFTAPDLAHGLLQPTTTASLKGQRRINVDLAGPFEEDDDGNTHVIVVVDRDDLWPTVEPIKGTEATETTRALCELASDSGVPEVLVSDRGSNFTFTSNHAKEFYDAMGIDPKHTTPESPWANGAAEALVKLTKGVLQKLVEERRTSWSRLLWLVKLVLRSRETTGFGISPFEARFARKMRTPAMFDLPFDDVASPEEGDLVKLKAILEKRRDEVAKKMKEKFDKKVKEADFEEGDLVWLVPRQAEGALKPRKIGPYKVMEVRGGTNVKIAQAEGGPPLSRHEVQSVRNLERYKHEEVYKQKELVVKEILGHEGKGRGRKYKVLWEDGSESMEPRKQLVDKEVGGEEVVNEQLLAYLARNPRLSSKA